MWPFFFRKVGLQSNIKYVTIFDVRVFIIIVYGSLVKRLGHRPFTAVTRVRFPSESLKILYGDIAKR